MHLPHHSGYFPKQFWKTSSVSLCVCVYVSLWGVINNIVNTAAKCHPSKKWACENIMVYFYQFIHWAWQCTTSEFSFKSKWPWILSGYWGSQDCKTKDTHERGLQTYFRKWHEWWHRSVQRKGKYFEGIDGNVFSTIVKFLKIWTFIAVFGHTCEEGSDVNGKGGSRQVSNQTEQKADRWRALGRDGPVLRMTCFKPLSLPLFSLPGAGLRVRDEPGACWVFL